MVWSVLLGAAVLVVVLQILIARAGPILKGRVIETLETRFRSRVELDDLEVSVSKGLNVTGAGLRIYPPDDVVAAGAKDPLIAVGRFDFRVAVLGLMFKPMHVGAVFVHGLDIDIPPRQMRQQGGLRSRHLGKMKIVVNEIVCDDSRLIIGTEKPNKVPKVFQLKHIVLHDVGAKTPSHYDAILTNAVPRGYIHAVGSFGPWDVESPGDSAVTGQYVFDNADLFPMKGIGGTLHSAGVFRGQLDRIAVQGAADVPNFSLDTTNHPTPLRTKFQAIVDGTSGDTYLQAVDAKLGKSSFACRGAVINLRGQGHVIDLDVDVPAGEIQDFLQLSVKTEPPVMTGVIAMKAHLHIRPGKESVTRKLSMKGSFALQQIHFTNPAVEDKVDMMSLRAQGEPKEAKPGAPDVRSNMTGQFEMRDGQFDFRDLVYTLPGADVRLTGVYSLDGRRFHFTGKIRTKAELSQMIASGWKSFLLKPIDPFFRKHGAGAEIPIEISGTRAAPHIAFDFHGMKLK